MDSLGGDKAGLGVGTFDGSHSCRAFMFDLHYTHTCPSTDLLPGLKMRAWIVIPTKLFDRMAFYLDLIASSAA